MPRPSLGTRSRSVEHGGHSATSGERQSRVEAVAKPVDGGRRLPRPESRNPECGIRHRERREQGSGARDLDQGVDDRSHRDAITGQERRLRAPNDLDHAVSPSAGLPRSEHDDVVRHLTHDRHSRQHRCRESCEHDPGPLLGDGERHLAMSQDRRELLVTCSSDVDAAPHRDELAGVTRRQERGRKARRPRPRRREHLARCTRERLDVHVDSIFASAPGLTRHPSTGEPPLDASAGRGRVDTRPTAPP